MKYFHWFKGFIFIALACFVTANGSTVDASSVKKVLSDDRNAITGNITVTAGQSENHASSAKLTVSGDNSRVSVGKEGAITLSAGRSIQLLPGTKISAGGFLYASIEPASKTSKHPKKEIRLVTVEENKKIEEQASLAMAAALFSPFPTRSKGTLHAGDAEHGSFTVSKNELSGVAPEQQRKVAVDGHLLPDVARTQILFNHTPIPAAYACRPETTRVLRL